MALGGGWKYGRTLSLLNTELMLTWRTSGATYKADIRLVTFRLTTRCLFTLQLPFLSRPHATRPGLIPTCIHGHTFTDIDLVHYNIFFRDIQSKVHKHNCDKKIVHNKCWVQCELCKSLAVDISVGGGKCIIIIPWPKYVHVKTHISHRAASWAVKHCWASLAGGSYLCSCLLHTRIWPCQALELHILYLSGVVGSLFCRFHL